MWALPLRQSWRRLTGVGAGTRCPRRGLDRGVLSHRTCRAQPDSLLSCSYLPSAPAGWPLAWASGRAGPGHFQSHGGRCGKLLLISSGGVPGGYKGLSVGRFSDPESWGLAFLSSLRFSHRRFTYKETHRVVCALQEEASSEYGIPSVRSRTYQSPEGPCAPLRWHAFLSLLEVTADLNFWVFIPLLYTSG